MWFSNSSHKWSRINLLALWLHAWPCGLLWSTEQSSGDSSVQFWYEAIKNLVRFCLLPWPQRLCEKSMPSLLVPGGRWETRGPEPQQVAALIKLFLAEPSPHLCRHDVRNKCLLLNARDVLCHYAVLLWPQLTDTGGYLFCVPRWL